MLIVLFENTVARLRVASDAAGIFFNAGQIVSIGPASSWYILLDITFMKYYFQEFTYRA